MTLFKTACGAVAVAALAAGCSSGPSQLQTATGDTKPQPVVVQVPVTTPELEKGCWAQFYAGRDFKGDVATLLGPVQLESADKFTAKQLKREIDSLVVGPKATLKVYKTAMFKDSLMTFGPNSREAGLITKLGVGGGIESMELSCTS